MFATEQQQWWQHRKKCEQQRQSTTTQTAMDVSKKARSEVRCGLWHVNNNHCNCKDGNNNSDDVEDNDKVRQCGQQQQWQWRQEGKDNAWRKWRRRSGARNKPWPAIKASRNMHFTKITIFWVWLSSILRFCRLGTFQVCFPIPSCHFITLLQLWSTVFLSINKIGLTE